ncbi:MAG: lipid-A-disaccharide synthase [Rhodospirillales bacterium]|nr:lipid-A-disaccharide synthase [Rhodospirillales bacterium]
MSKSVFFIAGEASGDSLGASLIRGLKKREGDLVRFSGIGGPLMGEQGLKSLFPMDDLCVMGLWEVIWQLPRLLRLIQGTVEEIEKCAPDVVVTIDLPDFNFEVAQRLKKRGIFKGKIVHYVAPSVWAWRSGRAKKIAGYLDGLMCLFPFEPAYFSEHGLDAAYVGHPLIEVDTAALDPKGFREDLHIQDGALCLGVLFGSRERELRSLSKPFLETIGALHEQYENLQLIAPTLPSLEYNVTNLLSGIDVPCNIVKDQNSKWDALASCDVALAASGTVALELSYLGVPHIIGYKAHPLTALILKLVVKTKYAHLANILLNEEVVPEYLQTKCSAGKLTRAMMRLLRYPEEQVKQKQAFARLHEKLQLGVGETPSERAAAYVLRMAA